MQTDLKVSQLLSILIVIFSATASLGGLFLNGLYRDNPFVTSVWKGNDLVTLVVAVPILILALVFSARGSVRAVLVWMGMLDYMLYNYAFYLFAAAFNWFFLIYVALLGLAMFALIFGLVNVNAGSLGRGFRERTPVGWIAGYMLLVAVGLTLVYLVQTFTFIFTGQLPGIIARTGHPTSIVFALDLTLLVPFLALGAVWLLQRKPWGFILAGVATVKGPLYTLVLTVGSMSAVRAGFADTASEVPLWVSLTVLGLVATALLYGNMSADRQANHQ